MIGEDETTDEDDFIEWGVSLDRLHFTTKVYTDADGRGSEAEAEALDRLITGLQSGEIEPTWNTTPQTRDDIHSEALYVYSQVCDHCNEYTEQEKREIVVDDDVEYVCPDCADDLRDICNECKRHRDDLDEDESMEVAGRTVVEYLCSTCYADDKQTVEP